MSDAPNLPTWGIVATVKAPRREILQFAAHHIEMGAHRIYLYLDDPDPAAAEAVNSHPKLRVTQTDDRYWEKKGKRPAKHQPRQTINAADAYAKRTEVDWLAHIDCDEFLAPSAPVSPPLPEQLAALPDNCLCARIRPVEALAWTDPGARPFKGFKLEQPLRQTITRQLYPEHGGHLNGGFLSHVAGKMIYRTGLSGFHVKIHNAFLGDTMNPGQQELTAMHLCHMHGSDWSKWISHFRYRLSKGAYRAELSATPGGKTMHDLLTGLLNDGGEDALHSFWREICLPRSALREGLADHGLLHWHDLPDPSLIGKHFPGLA